MAQTEYINALSPVGRIVSGDIFNPRTVDSKGVKMVYKSGAKSGQDRSEYNIGLAIDKNDPTWPAFYAQLLSVAKQAWPRQFDAYGNPSPTLSLKVTDGDSAIPNKKGVAPNTREGWPGCWVVFFSSSLTPKVMSRGGASFLTDPQSVKRGYYARVSTSLSSNNNAESPGIYVNLDALEFIAYGQEIVGGEFDPSVFAAEAVYMPAGATATPAAPATHTPPPPQAQTPPPPPGSVQPAHDFVNGPAPTPTAPPVVRRLASNGVAYTEDELRGFSWSAEAIAAAPIAP